MLTAKTVGRFIWIFCNNVYCIPTYAVWMLLLLPLKWLNPFWYWKVEAVLYEWLLNMVAAWNWSAGYKVIETGDSLDEIEGDKALFLFNHQSTSDVPLIMSAITARPGVTQKTMWIMDKMFRWTNFGLVSWIHGDFFISSGKADRDTALDNMREHVSSVYLRKGLKWIMLFPEGGFLYKRREASQRFAKKNDLPVLQHVSLPRVGAFKVLMDELAPDPLKNNCKVPKCDEKERLKWVVDVTVAYPDGEPLDLLAIGLGDRGPKFVIFEYKIYPVEKIPSEEEDMKTWIYTRYEEKEKKLSQYYSSKEYPGLKGCEPCVDHSPVVFIVLHSIFLISSLIHVTFVKRLIGIVFTAIGFIRAML